jgi:hypothetical protein
MSRFELDHVALLVVSIEAALQRMGLSADPSGIEEFPGEGTRELYVGDDDTPARLLLMQPIGPGPYERALRKRGEGLHHLAICVEDLAAFTESISGTGWLLHPQSIRTMKRFKQVWLCRPGVHTLVEVSKGNPSYHEVPVVTRVGVSVGAALAGLVSALSIKAVSAVADGPSTITIAGRDIEV